MKGYAIAFARTLPSKVVTERIIPWLTLFFSVLAGAFGLYQYYSSIEAAKVTETIKLHREFIGTKPGEQSIFETQTSMIDLNEKLGGLIDQTRCKYIKELIDKGAIVEKRNFNCSSNKYREIIDGINLAEEHRKVLRQRITKQQDSMVSTESRKMKMFRILGFYSAVTTCANQGGCNKSSVVSLFGTPMVAFINSYCSYFGNVAKSWNNEPADNDLVRFLVKNGVTITSFKQSDKERRNVFRCERHRAIEHNR
jgi:hypothetical protein